VGLEKTATVEEVFAHLEKTPRTVVLFVDQSPLCRQYTATSWVKDSVEIVEIDQEILDTFQIGKVPQFRFYLQGTEIETLVGTASREEFLETHGKAFQNVKTIQSR
jgi:sulfur carrier protein ThiS